MDRRTSDYGCHDRCIVKSACKKTLRFRFIQKRIVSYCHAWFKDTAEWHAIDSRSSLGIDWYQRNQELYDDCAEKWNFVEFSNHGYSGLQCDAQRRTEADII